MNSTLLHFPALSLRWIAVWRRNFLVWRKLAIASVLGNLADPLMWTIGLGLGIGALLPQVEGIPYITFIAGGMIAQSTMFSAAFEGMYSAFSRMHVQKTWDAIINAPVSLDEVVFAEWLWAASKAALSGTTILIVVAVLGLTQHILALWIIPLVMLIGLCFAALALIMTAVSSSYDFFTYFFTLVLTPMILISGVFFPIAQLPEAVQTIAFILPLAHAIALSRPLLLGEVPQDILLHLTVLLAYAGLGFAVALALTRKRLLK